MHRLTVLVIGGSRGVGDHLCREFARRGAVVLVHAREASTAQAAAHRLVRTGAGSELVHPVHADFRCLAQVHRLAEQVCREHGQLDVLVHNVRSMQPPGLTDDGIEATVQVNYVAAYALTRLLAPALNTAAGRIVTLTSARLRDVRVDGEDFFRGLRGPAESYARAQLARLLFTRALAITAEQRVTAVAVHSGVVDSGSFATLYGAGSVPVADGAAHVLHAADPATAVVNGGYYEGLLAAESAPQAGDDDAAVRLWRATARLLGWEYLAGAESPASADRHIDARPHPARLPS